MPRTTDLDVSALQIEEGFTLDTSSARATGPLADALRATLDSGQTRSIAIEEGKARTLMNALRNTANAMGLRSTIRVADESGERPVKLNQSDLSAEGVRPVRVHFLARPAKTQEEKDAAAAKSAARKEKEGATVQTTEGPEVAVVDAAKGDKPSRRRNA